MRISWIADCHLNKTNYKDSNLYTFTSYAFRAHDFMKSLEFIVDKNIDDVKPDLVVFLGDIYETFDPPNNITGFFSKQLRKLSEAKIPVMIIIGNHDICSKNHALQSLMELNLKNIRVVDKPTALKFKESLLMLFPYSVEVERKSITIKDQFTKFVEETKEKIKNNADLQNLDIFFAGHFPTKGAYMNIYTTLENDVIKEKRIINSEDKNITVDDLDSIGAKYVFLGDFHRHQILPTKTCKSMYVGSIERTDISEAKDDKGFVVYDTDYPEDEHYGKTRFVPYLTPRPIIRMSGNLLKINEHIDKLTDKDKGAIIQIDFEGTQAEIMDFDNAQTDVLNRIKKIIDPACVRRDNKIVDTDNKTKVEKIEKELNDSPIDAQTVMPVIIEMIDEREIDTEERKSLYIMAEDIYNSVKTKNQG